MRVLSPLLLALCVSIAAQASAQEPQVNDELIQDHYQPAREGDEGPARYAVERIDWRTASTIDLDESMNRPLPEDFVPWAVSYDPRTGEEYYTPMSLGTGPDQGWVSGSEILAEVPEWQESLGAATSISSTAFPWSTQCRMFFSQGASNFICSGTLVDAKTMLTAGHCVHEGGGGDWSTSVSISPGWDGDDDAWGSANSILLQSFTGWTLSGNYSWDIGFVRLDRPVGFLTSWLGYGYNNSDAYFTGNNFNFAAYPGCNSGCFCNFAGCPNQLYHGFGSFDSVNSTRLTANLPGWCFTGGMSGGGVYFFDGGTGRFVYGANSTRATSGCTIVSNTWTRITQPIFDAMLNTFIPGAYTAALDLVPLDVNANTSVRAGALLSTLNFLVANQSTANPASTSYGFEVYLSTNNNISEFDTLLQTRSFTWDFGPKSTVRVNSGGPRIPESTIPGTYWVGMILDVADANTGNNDTDGWDAAEITVLPRFSSLPPTAFVSSSGYVEDFQSLSNAFSYRLNADTLNFSSTAWVNYGNLGVNLDPYRGTRCLELGNDPGGGTVSPENLSALVMGFNGQNGTDLVLDFMMADWGEELDTMDGVWISSDGDRWYNLTPSGWGPLSPLATGRWYSVRAIQLTGATPVNTDDNFYLAFQVQDDFPFAGLDGIAIDDVRIHPSNLNTLTVSSMRSGTTSQLHMSSSVPGGLACFAASPHGAGPLVFPKGVILLTPPINYFPCQVIDGSGKATYSFAVPAGFTGVPVWFHAVKLPGYDFTNGLDLVIK